MRYKNDDPQSIIAMEIDRTGCYGEADCCGSFYEERETEQCPVCGAIEPEHFYMNDDEECVGCYECVHRVYELF